MCSSSNPGDKETIFEAALNAARQEVDLVPLLSVLLREAIRLRAKSVHIGSKQGGCLDWEFQSGSVASENIPLWMYKAIYESRNELFSRVAKELTSDGFATNYLGNQFKVSSSVGIETVLEIGD